MISCKFKIRSKYNKSFINIYIYNIHFENMTSIYFLKIFTFKSFSNP